jgi:cyclophilin family peptidyl-prolyl cis-trans isomerase
MGSIWYFGNNIGTENTRIAAIKDENFVVAHDHCGIVSMVNSGPNSARNEFMIIFKPLPVMDRKAVAFGQIIDGIDALECIQEVSTEYEKPEFDITIELKVVDLGVRK